jgi:hypothetical protein
MGQKCGHDFIAEGILTDGVASCSFFLVIGTKGVKGEELYVSADWPSQRPTRRTV